MSFSDFLIFLACMLGAALLVIGWAGFAQEDRRTDTFIERYCTPLSNHRPDGTTQRAYVRDGLDLKPVYVCVQEKQ